jgi:hypothetical protein
MKQRLFLSSVLLLLMVFGVNMMYAQKVNWLVGMRLGLSLVSTPGADAYNWQTGKTETVGGGVKAGFQFGPTAEVIFSKTYAVVENLNINTQTGTPIEWQSLFKYYFNIKGSTIKPYAQAGFSLIFITGGPYISIPFGGGALFQLAKNVYLPADLIFGPIFGGGTTVFGVEVTTGIRYFFD